MAEQSINDIKASVFSVQSIVNDTFSKLIGIIENQALAIAEYKKLETVTATEV